MADTPRGYRKETREVFVKKGADLSDSQKHRGRKSGLARDRKTNDLSHVVIGDRVESDSAPPQAAHLNHDWDGIEPDFQNEPDISDLVPLALVAAAGIVAVAGVKAVQSAKERRQAGPVEVSRVASSTATPAGWYEVANESTRLRYWNGVAWTDDYAHRATSAPSIAADWYPDPSDATHLRYWDGDAWTHHISRRPGAATAPADWYPDPSNAAQLRYWDGVAWTNHVTSGPGAEHGLPTAAAGSGKGLVPAYDQPRINMSSAEWQAHVRAWLQAGAIQQELWGRLSKAHIHDADDAILTAQQKMEELTPEEGALHIQRMLETHPALSEQAVLLEFLQLFGGDRRTPVGIDLHRDRRR